MTAVASPPTFAQHNRAPWGSTTGMNGVNNNPGVNGGVNGAGQIMNPDELNRLLMSRKPLQRNNSSSSISSASSAASTSTVATSASQSQQSNGLPASPGELNVNAWPNGAAANGANGVNGANPAPRKRPQPKAPWPSPKPESPNDFVRMPGGRQMINAINMNGASPLHAAPSIVPSQGQMGQMGQMPSQQAMPRPAADALPPGNQPVLYLLSLNGTFERKTISVPFSPDTLRIGRQTNAKTVPTPVNGFFDSKVLSRQHAEIWADRQGKIWIRDVKSSNGTFVNGTRLSQENRESEPHELQTGDHLELGIDIVSEDQKTVVHHKVAAKVEHAGYPSPSNNVLDLNFGDLDPANGPHLMMGPQGAVPLRRAAGQSSVANNAGRMAQAAMMGPQPSGIANQRGFFFSPISTEQIVKKLQSEMRNARLQSHDLGHTGNFVHTLLSKEDIKNIEKPEAPEPTKSNMVNGNAISFRTDGKTRFSEPPAPPPQQPLPEKPDVPSLRRGMTEKVKANGQNTSPVRQDGGGSQILALTEALNVAKKEIESQTSRMRDLEEMLQQERRARELAEELARRLEEQSAASDSASSTTEVDSNGTMLEATFEPPTEEASPSPVDTPMVDATDETTPDARVIEASAADLEQQIQNMVLDMADLRDQMENWRRRAETAESERDTHRQSLADMVRQIRQEAEAKELTAAQQKAASGASPPSQPDTISRENVHNTDDKVDTAPNPSVAASSSTESSERPTLSRTPTLRPDSPPSAAGPPNNLLVSGVPYASITTVVLVGMGLMAYINGLQPQPRLER